MTFTPEQLQALVRYRMRQAQETLQEAEILLKENALRGTVNRSYYAMYYSLLALLTSRQLSTSKHGGALSLFDREFVKTGLFPRDLSRKIRLAFNQRQTYDYGEIVDADQETAIESLQNAGGFVEAVDEFLQAEERPQAGAANRLEGAADASVATDDR